MQFRFDEIPVSARLNDTVAASLTKLKSEQKRRFRKKLWISCGSVAAAFAAAIIFCVSNPALAAKLPIIGSIFAGLEDDFSYAGDYSDRAQVLTQLETLPSAETPEGENSAAPAGEEAADAKNGASVPGDQSYSATDKGITLTASEIYSDGLSVFLSLKIHSEEPFGFNYEYAEDTGELLRDEAGNLIRLPAVIYPDGYAAIDSETVTFDSTSLFVEQLDEHNFNGMIKTDLPASMFGTGGDHTMCVSLRRFMADFCDENGAPICNSENIMDVSLQIDGSWTLELPFTADTSGLQVYNGLASSGEDHEVTDVYVSPYQVVARHNPVSDKWGNPVGGLACFDENGVLLEKGNQSAEFGTDVFSLNRRKPAELHFYVIDDWITSCKLRDEETAREQAVNTFTLPLSW